MPPQSASNRARKPSFSRRVSSQLAKLFRLTLGPAVLPRQKSKKAEILAPQADARAPRTALEKASHQQTRNLLQAPCRSIDSMLHAQLSDAFLAAHCGHRLGLNRPGIRRHSDNGALSFEKGMVSRANMDLETFRELCMDSLAIDAAVLQESLFRMCRHHGPKQPEMLSFQELLLGIAPLLTGSLEQRAAFMFVLYDRNENGSVDSKEIFALQASVSVDSALERDLLAFHRFVSGAAEATAARQAAPEEAAAPDAASSASKLEAYRKEGGRLLFFDDYLAHVRSGGATDADAGTGAADGFRAELIARLYQAAAEVEQQRRARK